MVRSHSGIDYDICTKSSLRDQKVTRRPVVNTLDETAGTHLGRLYAEVPISPTNYDAGFQKITFGIMANTVNGIAWWLIETLGPSKNFETLAYMPKSRHATERCPSMVTELQRCYDSLLQLLPTAAVLCRDKRRHPLAQSDFRSRRCEHLVILP